MTERPSILTIDDEPNNFDVIQTLLGTQNYTFHYASGGQRALDRLDRFQPDLILLDVMMPGLDGIEVCRQIRNSANWHAVPIVLMTALSDKAELARCLSTGADDFLVKPIGRLELLARVSSLLRLKLECDRHQLAAQINRDSLKETLRERLATVSRNLGASVEDLIGATQLLIDSELTPEQSVSAKTVLDCSHRVLALTNELSDIDRVNLDALVGE